MSRWTAAGFALAVMALALLGGCAKAAGTETYIIPDTAAEAPAANDRPFTVETIYPLLEGYKDSIEPLGWLDTGSVVALFRGEGSAYSVERVDFPYENRLKLREGGADPDKAALSPDGRFVTSVRAAEGAYALTLVALADGGETVIDSVSRRQLAAVRFAWSGSGRYVGYIASTVDAGVALRVYDTSTGQARSYGIPQSGADSSTYAAHLADDGESAVLIGTAGKQPTLSFGKLADGAFSVQYEHAVSRDGQAEWMNADQILFKGPEGTLYAYDRRNGALNVLQEQVGLFRLSPDRKFIAYSTGEDEVNAAALYGNSLVNVNTVYRGFTPSQLAWSPDSGKLLLSGWKAYAEQATESMPAPAPPGYSLVVAFK